MPRMLSWSNIAVPMYTRHKDCLVALSKKLTGVQYLRHRQHVLEMIDELQETINREQIRDILET